MLLPLLTIAQEKQSDSISAVNKFESALRQKLEKAEKPNLAGRYKADFKSLGKTLYAILMDWPEEKVTLTLPVFTKKSKEAKVTLLGYDKPLVYSIENNKLTVEFPELYPFQRACKYAYVSRFEGFEIE